MTKEFKYPELIYNHYSYHDMIDNHNLSRMHPISMEETWMTMHWANCIFCFLLAVTVMNIQNAACYFLNKSKMDAMQSRCLIVKQFTFNCHLEQEQASRKCPSYKTRNNSSHTHHGSDTHKIHPRVNCDLQDKIWKVEVH